MCEFCSKYGHQNRWYLNPDNFSDKLLQDKARLKVLDHTAGWGVDYYVERSSRLAPLTKVPLVGGLVKTYVNRTTPAQHGGQILSLEDALRLVDIARDFVALPCMCRRLVGGRTDMTCINFGPVKELTARYKPEEPMEELPPEEVKARVGWGKLEAVKNSRLFTFDDNLVSRPGPRLVDGLEQLAGMINAK